MRTAPASSRPRRRTAGRRRDAFQCCRDVRFLVRDLHVLRTDQEYVHGYEAVRAEAGIDVEDPAEAANEQAAGRHERDRIAISATTSVGTQPRPPRSAGRPCAPNRAAPGPRSARRAWRAGASPKRSALTTIAPAVKKENREVHRDLGYDAWMSERREAPHGLDRGVRDEPIPRSPPALTAMTSASVRCCAASRRASGSERDSNGRTRAAEPPLERSEGWPTLAQAISSTRLRRQRGSSSAPRTSSVCALERRRDPRRSSPRSIGESSRRAVPRIASRSASACDALTPPSAVRTRHEAAVPRDAAHLVRHRRPQLHISALDKINVAGITPTTVVGTPFSVSDPADYRGIAAELRPPESRRSRNDDVAAARSIVGRENRAAKELPARRASGTTRP